MAFVWLIVSLPLGRFRIERVSSSRKHIFNAKERASMKLREPVNALTHLGGAVAALLGQIVLWTAARGRVAVEASALLIYGLSLVTLFLASGLYHAARAGQAMVLALRRLDHAAIYLLIAGTYTPFCVLAMEGFWRWGFLTLIWTLAFLGIVVKMAVIHAPRWISGGMYLAMGWLALAAVGEMLRVLPPGALAWLLAGGLIYTFGAVVYATKIFNFWPGRFGFHEVWHVLVLLGALAHFIAIAGYVAPVG